MNFRAGHDDFFEPPAIAEMCGDTTSVFEIDDRQKTIRPRDQFSALKRPWKAVWNEERSHRGKERRRSSFWAVARRLKPSFDQLTRDPIRASSKPCSLRAVVSSDHSQP